MCVCVRVCVCVNTVRHMLCVRNWQLAHNGTHSHWQQKHCAFTTANNITHLATHNILNLAHKVLIEGAGHTLDCPW